MKNIRLIDVVQRDFLNLFKKTLSITPSVSLILKDNIFCKETKRKIVVIRAYCYDYSTCVKSAMTHTGPKKSSAKSCKRK